MRSRRRLVEKEIGLGRNIGKTSDCQPALFSRQTDRTFAVKEKNDILVDTRIAPALAFFSKVTCHWQKCAPIPGDICTMGTTLVHPGSQLGT